MAAKEDLDRSNVPYEYYDVKTDEGAMKKMLQLAGVRKVPVIVEDGDVKVGFGGT